VFNIIVTRVQDIKAGVAIFLVEPRPFYKWVGRKEKEKKTTTQQSVYRFQTFFFLYMSILVVKLFTFTSLAIL